MPHIIIEYSANLIPDLDISALTRELHGVLDGLYNISQNRIRTRAIKLDNFLVGDRGGSGHMVHITLKLLTGRTVEAQKEMGQILASVTKKFIPSETSITVEIVELDKETYFS